MDDSQIVTMFWQRNEQAIVETSSKYGRYCYAIAHNILANKEDADESVNDTYLGAWESMPPHRPAILSTFLGKLTRRISLNKWRDKTRDKRGGGEVPLALDELSECISSDQNVEATIQLQELTRAINRFLSSLSETERDIFVCRYWHLAPILEISEKFGFSESKTKSMLFRVRGKLQKYLKKEELM